MISINKFISSSGFCSRREADELIKQGRVIINNRRASLTDKYETGDTVKVDDHIISSKKKLTYIAFHKPMGVTSTTDRKDRTNIIDFIGHEKRIFPIGRLDKDSTGLILLTDDGDIVNHILRSENNHEKEYLVRVNRPIGKDFKKLMSSGTIVVDKKRVKPCKVQVVSKYIFRITLTQGLNRQIRKMCKSLGYRVSALHRERVMHIQLGKLKVGKLRKLTESEIQGLKK